MEIVFAVILMIVSNNPDGTTNFTDVAGGVSEMTINECLKASREVNTSDTSYVMICVPKKEAPIEG